MGSCSSKQREHEFTLLKDKVSELDKLQETIDKLDKKLQIHESYALSYFKKHDAIEKSVKLHQAHARGYYTEHDQLVQSYKADKAAEPVYKMLELNMQFHPWNGCYKYYGRCYKFKVGDLVNIYFTTKATGPGSNPTLNSRPNENMPDGLSFDRAAGVLRGTVTTMQSPIVYYTSNWTGGCGGIPYELISIEIV